MEEARWSKDIQLTKLNFVVLRIKHRALSMLGKGSAMSYIPAPSSYQN
jgi:hypothetical protein